MVKFRDFEPIGCNYWPHFASLHSATRYLNQIFIHCQIELLSFLVLTVCVPQELGKGNVSTVDGNCYHDLTTRFFVRIAAGRACFNNITDNSMAVYSCNCDGNYTLSDPTMSNRTCQNGGWSGEIPQCIPNCKLIL